MPDTGTYLDDLPDKAPAPPAWDDVKDDFTKSYPQLDPAKMQEHYERQRTLTMHRQHAAQPGVVSQSIPATIERESIPFLSSAAKVDEDDRYKAASERFNRGSPAPADYETIAKYEERHKREANQSLAQSIGTNLAKIPAIAGEAYVAGQVVPGGAFGTGVKPFLARQALKTPLMPSLYQEGASKRSVAQGGEWTDPKNLATPLAMGMVQNIVLGSLGEVAGGFKNPATRFVAKVGAGMGEQAGIDVAAGAVDSVLPDAYKTNTKYGLIGEILEGKNGDALKTAVTQAVTFAAFTAMHGNPKSGKEVIEHTKRLLDDQAKKGVSADKVAQDLASIIPKEEAQPAPQQAATQQPAQAPPEAAAQPPQTAPEPPISPQEASEPPKEESGAPVQYSKENNALVAQMLRSTGLKGKNDVEIIQKAERSGMNMKPLREAAQGVLTNTGQEKPRQNAPGTPISPQGGPEATSTVPEGSSPQEPAPATVEKPSPGTALGDMAGENLWDRMKAGHNPDVDELQRHGLSENEAKVIALRGMELTHKEIGKQLGPWSKQFVKKLEKNGLAKLGVTDDTMDDLHTERKLKQIQDVANGHVDPQSVRPADVRAMQEKVDDAIDEEVKDQKELEKLMADYSREPAGEKESDYGRRLASIHAKVARRSGAEGQPAPGAKPASPEPGVTPSAGRASAIRVPPTIEPAPSQEQRTSAAEGPGAGGERPSPTAVPSPTGNELNNPFEPRILPAKMETVVIADEIKKLKAQAETEGKINRAFTLDSIADLQKAVRSGVATFERPMPPPEGFSHGRQGSKDVWIENKPKKKPPILDFGKPVTPEERSVLPGGGQEDLPSAEQRTQPQRTMALANASIDAQRVKEQKSPILKQAEQADPVVWQKAMDRLQADPKAGEKLVDELTKNPRPASDVENMLLLHRETALRNEADRAMLEYLKATQGGHTAEQLDAMEKRVEDVEKLINQTDEVAKSSGSEAGRAFRLRQLLMAEDFSLSGMMRKATAAKKAPLTPEEQQKIGQQHAEIDAAQKGESQADESLAGLKGTESVKSGAALTATSEFQAKEAAGTRTATAKGAFNTDVATFKKNSQTYTKRILDTILDWRRAFILSNPVTLAKIGLASGARIGIAPIEEAAGTGLRQIPVLSQIAALAAREGKAFSGVREKAAAMSAFTKGIADAWETVKTGSSELKKKFGPDSRPRTWASTVSEIHAAIKAPAARAEYTRAFLMGLDDAIARGQDVTNGAVLTKIGLDAYKHSERAIFMNNGAVANFVNERLKSKYPAAEFALRMAVPVSRVPTNIVVETMQYALGSVTGSAHAGIALSKGLKNLKPGEADLIMRQLKKGSLGAALLIAGIANPQYFGGYYQPGKKKEGEPDFMTTRTPQGDIPGWAQHNPLLVVPQIGATIRRVADKKYRGEEQGYAEGSTEAALAIAGEVPLVKEMEEVGKIYDSHERGYTFGNSLRGLAEPQLMQWLAGRGDIDPATGKPTKRAPKTVVQDLKMGIPGKRQEVPAKNH